jgi:hypothetical protein
VVLYIGRGDTLHFKEAEILIAQLEQPALFAVLSQINPVHTLILYVFLRCIVILFPLNTVCHVLALPVTCFVKNIQDVDTADQDLSY